MFNCMCVLKCFPDSFSQVYHFQEWHLYYFMDIVSRRRKSLQRESTLENRRFGQVFNGSLNLNQEFYFTTVSSWGFIMWTWNWGDDLCHVAVLEEVHCSILDQTRLLLSLSICAWLNYEMLYPFLFTSPKLIFDLDFRRFCTMLQWLMVVKKFALVK